MASASPITRIGVISDTHGFLDSQVLEVFKGVDHIVHGGDIGLPWLILELESLAPVTAVLGNADTGLNFKETELIEIGRRKLLIHHALDVNAPAERIKRRIIRENPDVVVFGHTHKPFCETINDVLYFNPGYAGKPRFNLPRSIAILTCDDQGITADYFGLD